MDYSEIHNYRDASTAPVTSTGLLLPGLSCRSLQLRVLGIALDSQLIFDHHIYSLVQQPMYVTISIGYLFHLVLLTRKAQKLWD